LANIDWSQVLIGMVVLLFSLSIHESAHAWVANRLGDSTGRYLGRITLNPIPHIDLIGTIIFPLLGMLTGFMFGWAKPVPVNTANLKNPRRDHVLIAAAGPVSNLIAALGFLLVLRLMIGFFPQELEGNHSVVYPLYVLSFTGVFLNLILAVFNLIPVPPLDGSWVLAGILPARFGDLFDAIRPYSFILLVALLWSGLIDVLLSPVLALMHVLVS